MVNIDDTNLADAIISVDNGTTDSVANTYRAGLYNSASDTFSITLTLDTIITTGPTLNNVVITLSGSKGTAVSQIDIQNQLQLAGVPVADAAIIAGYFTGTLDNASIHVNWEALLRNYGTRQISTDLSATHNYTDGNQLNSVTSANAAASNVLAIVVGHNSATGPDGSGSVGDFIQLGYDTNGDLVEEQTSTISANTGSNTFNITGSVVNGSVISSRIYDDLVGTTLLSEERRRIPTPAVSLNSAITSDLIFTISNSQTDNVANTYRTGLYAGGSDTFRVEIVFDSITHNGGGSVTPNVVVSLSGPSSQAVTVAGVQAELIGAGITAADAAALAALITGTLGSIHVNWDTISGTYSATSITVNAYVSHVYSDAVSLESPDPASDSFSTTNAVLDFLAPATLQSSGSVADFVQFGVDVDANSVEEAVSAIQAFTGTNTYLSGSVPTNGSIIALRVYDDGAGTTLLDQQRKRFPTPSNSIGSGVLTNLSLTSSNTTQDNVANVDQPGYYTGSEDIHEQTITLDIVDDGTTTANNVSFVLSGESAQAIDTTPIVTALTGAGITAGDAATIAGYFTGTYGSVSLNFEQLAINYDTRDVQLSTHIIHVYSDLTSIKSVSASVSGYTFSNTTVAPNIIPSSFQANVPTNVDPLAAAVDPEGDTIAITHIEGIAWDFLNRVNINRSGVDVEFLLETDGTITITANGALSGEVFNYTATDDNPIQVATANGQITVTTTASDNPLVSGLLTPNLIGASGSTGAFINYAIDTDGDNNNEEIGAIVANTGSNSFVTTLAVDNGYWLVVRTYVDALGTGGPTGIEKKQIPTPLISMNVPGENAINIVSSNQTPDNVSNLYNEPDDYIQANDTFEITINFDNITHNAGATTTPNVSITLSDTVGKNVSTLGISAALIAEGITAADAAIIEGYFTGTIENMILDFTSMKTNYQSQTIGISLHVTHNYTNPVIALKSVTASTANYDSCAAVTIDPAATLYNTWGSAPNADGTVTVRFNSL